MEFNYILSHVLRSVKVWSILDLMVDLLKDCYRTALFSETVMMICRLEVFTKLLSSIRFFIILLIDDMR